MEGILRHIYTGGVTLADFSDPHNAIAVLPSKAVIEFYANEGIDYAGFPTLRWNNYAEGNKL